MMPTIDRLRRQGFPIVKVDIGANANSSSYYGIKTLPTILIKQVRSGRQADWTAGGTAAAVDPPATPC